MSSLNKMRNIKNGWEIIDVLLCLQGTVWSATHVPIKTTTKTNASKL